MRILSIENWPHVVRITIGCACRYVFAVWGSHGTAGMVVCPCSMGTVAAIAGGSVAVRRVEDYAFKAAAIGLVVGGIAAILLWPTFDVS